MCILIEKWLWRIVVAGVILVAGFRMSALKVQAEEIIGSEGVFTHSHQDGCYESVTVSCVDKHVRDLRVDQEICYCTTCGRDTSQHALNNTWSCPIKGYYWQQDCYRACNVCGTYSATWGQNMPGYHYYEEKQIKCGMTEGESTASIKIVADNGWTNTGVNLTVQCNILKQDLSSDGINLSWEGGSILATENGTYTVMATNGQGKEISSTIQISCIDKITPVIEGVAGNEGTMTDDKIEVTVTASDSESGLAEAPYSVDGGVTWGSAATFWVEEGRSIAFAVRDKAGNIATTAISRNQFPYPPKIAAPAAPSTPEASSTPAEPATSNAPLTPAESSAPVTKSLPEQEGNFLSKEQMKQEKEPVSAAKKTLTAEEQEQAYGISVMLQKRARDTFFTQSRVTKSENKPEEDAIISDVTEEIAPLKVSVPEAETGVVLSAGEQKNTILTYLKQNAATCAGVLLCLSALSGCLYLLWLHSAVLYCYEGGDEYRKIGVFHLKKGKEELELYLPDYILQSTKAFRYRLMLRNRLVKRCANHDLVVYNEDNKLRQQVEECVDFVL